MLKLHSDWKRPITAIKEFIKLEASSGILLFCLSLLALLLSNSPWVFHYNMIVNFPLGLKLSNWQFQAPANLWVNDGLMALFFLLVGLEIKREILIGELSAFNKILLPGVAAIGGMLVPALIYYACNWHDSTALRGWAIPTATDIAFALAIMSLLGKRVPLSLKLFLMALAIFDDVGAIVVIAIFYTSHIKVVALGLAIVCTIALILLNYLGVTKLIAYWILGLLLWLAVLKSGVHATLAGVVLATTIPLTNKKNTDLSPLKALIHRLHPWVAYGILPLFGFMNAGISFAQLPKELLFSPVPVGIILGLLIGKQIGITGAVWLCVKCKFAKLPQHVNWLALYSCAVICGVGFTMSLFIGNLAFENLGSQSIYLVRFGVFLGSLIAGIMGYVLLRIALRQPQPSN